MKSFFTIVSLILILASCSQKTAFSKFNMSKADSLGENSLQSSKVTLNGKVDGVVSVVYLNSVYPKIYNNKEYFFVYYFLKDKKNVKFILNSQVPVKIIRLKPINQFSSLIHSQSKWNKYYLVEFKKSTKNLKFLFKNNEASSNILIYNKDED